MQSYIVFSAIVLSLLLYLIPARRQARENFTGDAYYTARGTFNSGQYANSQVAYQLQMATIFPFFLLSISGQWWVALINTLFFAIGIWLYRLLLPRFAAGAADLIDRKITVHQAIAELNGLPRLRILAALLTVVAFLGTAMFEMVWGARVFEIAIGGDRFMYDLVVVSLASYLVMFVWIGGQPAAIRADQLQLLVAYVGLHLLVGWIAWQPNLDFTAISLPIIVPAIITVSGAMVLWRLFTTPWRTGRSSAKLLSAFTIVSVAGMILSLILPHPELQQTVNLADNWAKVREAFSSKHFVISAVAVAVLPLFFQFVDMTSWQRLASVQEADADTLRERRRGLMQYLIESPLSWLLPIFIGIACIQVVVGPTNPDPWKALLEALLGEGSLWGSILASIVFAGLLAVFLSTAAELLNGIGMAVSYDLWRPAGGTEVTRDEDVERRERGRLAFAIATAVVVVLFLLAERLLPTGGEGLIGIFMAFYTPMVALAPSLLVPAIFRRRAHPTAVVLSLAGGAALGLSCGLWSVIQPTAFDGLLPWLGGPLSFVFAWGIYFAGLPFGSAVRNSKATAAGANG